MRTSAGCCKVWQVRDYTLWRAPPETTLCIYARDNDEKGGRPLTCQCLRIPATNLHHPVSLNGDSVPSAREEGDVTEENDQKLANGVEPTVPGRGQDLRIEQHHA
jgi:hypothetical protein